MLSLIKENRVFIYSFLVFIFIGSGILLIFPKAAIHLAINQQHNGFFDIFFSWITHLGSGWMILILFILLLFIKYKYAWILLLANFFITLVVQILKKQVFTEALRPKAFFEGVYDLYLVPGVSVHSLHSFPSGHAATALSVFFVISFVSPKQSWKFICFVLGLLTAFSRVYISQHFLGDIVVGSTIGFIITFLALYYFEKLTPGKSNGSLIQKFNKS